MANPYMQVPQSGNGGPWWRIEWVLAKRIVSLGLPVVVGMVTQTAINTVDLVMIGRLPEEVAVPGTAAILAAVVVLWAFGGFLSAISVGTQAVSARRFSEGKLKQVGAALTNSLLVAAAASLLITGLALWLAPRLLQWMVPSPEVLRLANSYGFIRLLGLPSMALTASYKSFYDGIGQVRVHMTVAVGMSLLNAVLDYILIFGGCLGGICVEPMHVDGAAWGSLFSSYAGLLCMVLWSLRSQDRSRFAVYRWRNARLSVGGTIARLSLWSGLASLILMTGVVVFISIVAHLDVLEQARDINSAACSIIVHIMMIVFVGCLAFGTATAVLVSQSIGAGLPALAERYGKQSALLAMYVMGMLGALAALFPQTVLHLFLPADFAVAGDELKEMVIARAVPSLRLAALIMTPLSAGAMVLTQALYGAGKTRYVMVVELVLHFGCLVPLAWLFAIPLRLGLLGCWIAATLYAAGLFGATAWAFARGKWKTVAL
ncbi:MAG: MATE family efflux transporter [Myxococcota bacterium]